MLRCHDKKTVLSQNIPMLYLVFFFLQVTNAIRNCLKYSPSGQPETAMGIGIALSPTPSTTANISKSAITNASFRATKLPGMSLCGHSSGKVNSWLFLLSLMSYQFVYLCISQETNHAFICETFNDEVWKIMILN